MLSLEARFYPIAGIYCRRAYAEDCGVERLVPDSNGVGGRLVQTAGINVLPLADQSVIRTPDNDPYGEHDFGSFEHKCYTV